MKPTTISAKRLLQQYGRDFRYVLSEHLELVSGNSFKVIKPLPSQDEYDELLKQWLTKNIGDRELERFWRKWKRVYEA